MLKLIVFDCDGVMFDSREANRAYYNDLLRAFSHPPMNESELDYVHMNNVNDSVNFIFSKYPGHDLEVVQRYRATVDYSPYLSHMTIEPDLVPFLELTKPHFHLAISTNRTNTMRPLLAAYELSGYFDKIVTALDVARPKPAPDALLDILEYFDCSPEEAIYIGDSAVDQQHAAAAGIRLIAFKNSNLKALYHVRSFAEIAALPPFAANRSSC